MTVMIRNLSVALAVLVLALATSLAANAEAPKAGTKGKVSGTITQIEKGKITIRDGSKNWEFERDFSKCVVDGVPQVDREATVEWLAAKNGNLWATKIYVPQTAKNSVTNKDLPEKGSVTGVVTHWGRKLFTVRADGKEYVIAFDLGKTEVIGKPAIDGNATVWWSKDKMGTLFATKVQVKQ
ncbi:MAG: hypothetical protein FJX76_19230 [Armatimonadetes bacterium]|nr:hypothetical protein [Armatimonadota bacterium]